MRHVRFMLAVALIPAAVAIAQDLPPGVLLLSQVKNQIKRELHRLPNISCIETVQREYQPAKGKMHRLDTIRLEVLTNGDKELFASPGERRFSDRHPMTYAGGGLLSDGMFGLYLKEILVTGNVSNQYKGEEEIGGRRLARYDYRLPVMWSGQTIQTKEGSGRVGYHGSYWADPRTYDVARLELNADDLPSTLPIAELVTIINYARTGLEDNLAVLLPESAEIRLVESSGEIKHNRVEFTHCRVFGANSTIDFSSPGSPQQTLPFGVASVDDTLRPLPAGLEIAVTLRSRISEDMSVGALIDGVVAGNVTAKGAVVVAAGSPVRGRIRRLERYTDPFPHFVVGLEFTEVELQGIRHGFYADVVEIESAPGIEQTVSFNRTQALIGRAIRENRETLSLPNLPGVATFFVRGGKLDLPRDFRTVWKTRLLAP